MTVRADRIEDFFNNGTLLRKGWGDGKETACLLVAIAPEVGEGHYENCPAEVMPEWLARLTVWMDDSGSDEAWPAMVKRYAAVARRWHVLDETDWKQLDFRVRSLCVREAVHHTTDKKILAVCDTVIALCDRAGRGEFVSAEEWSAGAAAAVWSAAGAARAAAGAATWAAAEAARAAAVWAAESATRAAVDKLTNAILNEIEETCKKKESK
jgi:hypothetical protein